MSKARTTYGRVEKYIYGNLIENFKRKKDLLVELDANERTILKWPLRTWDMKVWAESI
jgi:hypothetical protein